jgi:hypothetical protein
MLVLAAADTLAGVAQTATTITCTIFGMELSLGVEVYKALYQGQLASSAATIYTAPGSTTSFIKSVHVVNTNTGAAQTFQLFRGGTAAANAITPVITIPAGGWAIYGEMGWVVYNSDGSQRSTGAMMLMSRTRILTGTTTYTIPSGCRAILVRCIGGGGGGGGGTLVSVSAACGAGGGGGAYSEKFITAPKLTAYTVAVGAGGLAGANTGAVGGTGGDTTFDSAPVCTAKGGIGGLGQVGNTTNVIVAGGGGGPASSGVGDVLLDGGPGGPAVRTSGTVGYSGNGGDAAGAEGGGGGLGKIAVGAGNVGGNYGGGGAGGLVLNGSTAVVGGAGAPGVIIVEEFG